MPVGIEEAAMAVVSVLSMAVTGVSWSVSMGSGIITSGGICMVLCIVGATVVCCRYLCVDG